MQCLFVFWLVLVKVIYMYIVQTLTHTHTVAVLPTKLSSNDDFGGLA